MKRDPSKRRRTFRIRPFAWLPFARDRSGVTALEFALSAPIALFLLFAVIEFGRAIFTQGMMLFAAEEATRWAIVNYDATPAQIQAKAAEAMDLAGLKNNATIVATNPVDPLDQTKNITVTISYDFQIFMPFGKVDPIRLTADSEGFLAEQ